MLEEGLVEELKKYRNKVVDCNIEKAIGFHEINSYIDNTDCEYNSYLFLV